jgi:hypothetical protein
MKKESTPRSELIRLGLVYCGLLALLFLLPENNPTLNGFVLALYAAVSFIGMERR